MRKLRIGGIVLAVTALVYVGLWFAVSEYARVAIVAALDDLEEESVPPVQFSYSDMVRGGFPLGIRWVLSDFRFHTLYEGGFVDATGDSLTLQVSLLEPEAPLAVLETIRAMSEVPGRKPDVFGASSLKVWFEEDENLAVRTEYRATGFFFEGIASTSEVTGVFLVDLKEKDAAYSPTYSMDLNISGITPTGGGALFLPPGPGEIALRIIAKGEGLFEASTAEAYEKWRDAGGTVALESLTADWPKTNIEADAVFTLDEQLRPSGAGTVAIEGMKAFIQHLIGAKLLDTVTGTAGILGLAALPKFGGQASRSEVRLPLTIENGAVHLGPFPVGKVDPIAHKVDPVAQ